MAALAMQNHSFQNDITSRFWGPVQRRPKILPNLGRLAVHAGFNLKNGWLYPFENCDFALQEHQFTWIYHRFIVFIYLIEISIAMRGAPGPEKTDSTQPYKWRFDAFLRSFTSTKAKEEKWRMHYVSCINFELDLTC